MTMVFRLQKNAGHLFTVAARIRLETMEMCFSKGVTLQV